VAFEMATSNYRNSKTQGCKIISWQYILFLSVINKCPVTIGIRQALKTMAINSDRMTYSAAPPMHYFLYSLFEFAYSMRAVSINHSVNRKSQCAPRVRAHWLTSRINRRY